MGFIILPAPEYHLVHKGNSQHKANESTQDPTSLFKFRSDYSGLLHQLLKSIPRFQEGLDIQVSLIIPQLRLD